MRDNNINDKGKIPILALLLFSIAEIELTEYQETMMHDVNIKDMMKLKPSILALSLFSSI